MLSSLLSSEKLGIVSLEKNNRSLSSVESWVSFYCNNRILELPRTPLLLMPPNLVVGGSWMMDWAETMMELFIDEAAKLKRNKFTILDEIMVMALLLRGPCRAVLLCLVA